MKKNLRSYYRGILLLIVCIPGMLKAQTSVFNPNDPVVNYDSLNPPAKPVNGQVGKWVRTPKLSWGTTSFKCYIYKNLPFRLKFPKNYDPAKRYPILIFFHGKGEYGRSLYDNEYQLANGGQKHMNAVDAGKLNAFLLYPQSQTELWSTGSIDLISELLEKIMIPGNMVDPFKVYIDGLSAGGAATWMFLMRHVNLVAAAAPISAASLTYIDSVNSYKFTPIYHFQGALDPNPSPNTSRSLGNNILAAGGNYKYKEYPNLGHTCWEQAWSEPDYFPFYNQAHKANPWALFGKTQFCQGDAINVTIGVTPGFDGYEWRKDGVVISGATSNQIVATSLGTYDCRIKRGTEWSDWSPVPVVLKMRTATVQPTIKVTGLASKLLPAPDTINGVPLEVPDGYYTYTWQKVGSSTTLSNTRFLLAPTPGDYQVRVTVKEECSSYTVPFSKAFTVLNANGPSGPPPVTALTATALSKTSIQLNWSQTSTPTYNETGFEIYRSDGADAPFKLMAITAADASGYTFSGLTQGTLYTFKVRAINNNAASSIVSVSTSTLADTTPPTTPGNLVAGSITQTSVTLSWTASTDDVGVSKYDIYVNGVRTYVGTSSNSYVARNLRPGVAYSFAVKARDASGNTSALSNTVSAITSGGNLKPDPAGADFSVYVNFNLDNPASAPWNNTNKYPSAGLGFSNLTTGQGFRSGVNVTIVNNFSGYNPDGMNTGTNTGVYPDNVMRSSYYCDKGITARLKIDGLPLTYKYTFVFFGSRNGSGNRTAVYTIGTQTASLNASMNSTNTVQISNIVTDSEGQVFIDITADPASMYAYLNSLVIKGYAPGSVAGGTIMANESMPAAIAPSALNENAVQATAYPNPFIDNVTISLPMVRKTEVMSVKLADMSGRVILARQFKDVPEGLWQQSLPLNDAAIQPGMYLLYISGLPDNKTQVIKLIRKK